MCVCVAPFIVLHLEEAPLSLSDLEDWRPGKSGHLLISSKS